MQKQRKSCTREGVAIDTQRGRNIGNHVQSYKGITVGRIGDIKEVRIISIQEVKKRGTGEEEWHLGEKVQEGK